MSEYYIKWKGVESGPYAINDVLKMYNIGKIGLLHSVREADSEDWILLRDFINKQNQGLDQQPHKKNESKALMAMTYLSYVLAGASFLSPYILIFALLAALGVGMAGDKKSAAILVSLSLLMAILGLVFFNVFYPILMN